MKPQKSIIKELKTYEHNLYKTGTVGRLLKIDDFPVTSRKPIEWQDCDQFIKLRQLKCEKKKAIALCQQFKIHRSEAQFYETIHNISTSNKQFQKIQTSASFLLRKIKQKQEFKKKMRSEFQDTQVDQKMSSILDNSFEKFQKSLDKHLEDENNLTHTFNLKQLTKEQLLKKLQLINEVPKKQQLKLWNSQHKIKQAPSITSAHQSQTERRSSKPYTPSPGKNDKGSYQNFSQSLIKLNQNQRSNKSLLALRKQSEDKRSQNPGLSIHSNIRSMQYIQNNNEGVRLKKTHYRHLTNFDYFQTAFQ